MIVHDTPPEFFNPLPLPEDYSILPKDQVQAWTWLENCQNIRTIFSYFNAMPAKITGKSFMLSAP